GVIDRLIALGRARRASEDDDLVRQGIDRQRMTLSSDWPGIGRHELFPGVVAQTKSKDVLQRARARESAMNNHAIEPRVVGNARKVAGAWWSAAGRDVGPVRRGAQAELPHVVSAEDRHLVLKWIEYSGVVLPCRWRSGRGDL